MSFSKQLVLKLSHRGLLNWMSDKLFIKLMYRVRIGKKIELKNPKTFNEKLQWLKLYDRKPEYVNMVDKYEVKKYVSERIGEEYIIPTLGVWDKFEDINFDLLPDQFVLKTTHDSGGVVICSNKKEFSFDMAQNKIAKSLKRNYYLHAREWPYKTVPPRIIAEQFVKDGDNEFLPVYKFLCFNGEPKIIQTIQNDKQPNESIDYFDVYWNLLDLRQNYPNSENHFSKPKQLDNMLEIARKLSRGYKFIRVDLYLINDEIKFSEYTFFSDAGMAKFEPEEWDNILGDWLKI